MIWESSDWKEPLLETAAWLGRVKLRTRTQSRILVKIEREVLVGFYAVRKLLDAAKLSDSTRSTTYPLSWYPAIKKVHLLNWHRIGELYDFSREKKESRDLRFICNLFVHSYVFMVCGDRLLEGVFVASDRTRDEKGYYVTAEQIADIFRLVGSDYPTRVQLHRDSGTDDFEVCAE